MASSNPDGSVILKGGQQWPESIDSDGKGNLYFSDGTEGTIYRIEFDPHNSDPSQTESVELPRGQGRWMPPWPDGLIRMKNGDLLIAAFKKRILCSYRANGWKFLAAFGDSSTDFKAYDDAGIPHVIALQRVGESECQPGKFEKWRSSWSGHDEEIQQLMLP